MKVLIFGSKGMLGSELVKQLDSEDLIALDSEDLDITNKEAVQKKILELKPEVIFNCAAYNGVDAAESESKDIAMLLNSEAVGYIAEAAEQVGSVLVYYSTGFVFEGSENGYTEDAQPNPQSVYAKSKLLGEQEAALSSKHYIIRLNLLFGKGGVGPSAKKSFPDLILELAKEQKDFDFVTDEISTPTYAADLAQASIQLVKEGYPYGIYHLPNEGSASWYDYAKEVFDAQGIEVKLNGVSADSFVRAAKRPKNSVIINTKFPKLRPWREALREYLKG